jgi:hypothetical protein
MRIASFLVSAVALGFAGAASAQTIQPVSYSPDFQEALEDDLGVREGAYLSETLSRYVAEALEARGLSGRQVQIELSIVNARPNRPTFEQAASTPGLDSFNSISIGGAELQGVVRNSSGAVIQTVEHRYYSHDLWYARYNADTWGDARRAMRRFATKVADAVALSAS